MLGRGELRKDLSSGWLDSLSGAAKEVNSHGRRAHGNYFQEKIRQLIVIPFFSWKVFQASSQQQLEQGNNVPPRKETTPGHSPLSHTRNTLYWNVLTTRHGAHSSKISKYDCWKFYQHIIEHTSPCFAWKVEQQRLLVEQLKREAQVTRISVSQVFSFVQIKWWY